MKVTVNGITFEGSEDEVKRMIEWQEKRMTTPTCGGGSSAGEPPTAPYEVTMGCPESTAPSPKIEGGEFVSDAEAKPAKKTCPRGHCRLGYCEYYIRGECHAICYPTYPPQYDKCVFCGSDSNTAM